MKEREPNEVLDPATIQPSTLLLSPRYWSQRVVVYCHMILYALGRLHWNQALLNLSIETRRGNPKGG
jgi:hypothetical protein